MSTHYDLLTEGEKAYWDAYANLRGITDWAGFSESQNARKLACRTWLQEKRKEIWRLAQDPPDGDGQGWDHANRRERYETLKDEHLNGATVRRQECTLPAGACTDSEKSLIEEREVWWVIDTGSVSEDLKALKQACTDELIERRKQLWHLGEDDGWDENNRSTRYDKLCIATKHGSAYSEWDKTHDAHGKASGDSSRQRAMDHMKKRVGYTENPADSNFDDRSDGIKTSQRHTAGGDTWLDRQPWCGCWCYYALESAGVQAIDSHLASVAQIEDYARKGQKCYRGWTTDRSKILRGDLVVIGGYGVHVEMVRDDEVRSDGGIYTYGGNTSPGSSGSQSNGGGAYERVRYPGEVRGFALVEYPG